MWSYRVDNLQERVRYVGVLWQGQVSAGQGFAGKQSYPLPDAFLAFLFLQAANPQSWGQDPGKGCFSTTHRDFDHGIFSREPAMLIPNAAELLDSAEWKLLSLPISASLFSYFIYHRKLIKTIRRAGGGGWLTHTHSYVIHWCARGSRGAVFSYHSFLFFFLNLVLKESLHHWGRARLAGSRPSGNCLHLLVRALEYYRLYILGTWGSNSYCHACIASAFSCQDISSTLKRATSEWCNQLHRF